VSCPLPSLFEDNIEQIWEFCALFESVVCDMILAFDINHFLSMALCAQLSLGAIFLVVVLVSAP